MVSNYFTLLFTALRKYVCDTGKYTYSNILSCQLKYFFKILHQIMYVGYEIEEYLHNLATQITGN